MGNSLRCCLACVLPCGALDLILIVHLNGHIEEYSRPVFASVIVTASPGNVLIKHWSSHEGGATAARILIVSPESELKRGSFYFLIPTSSIPDKKCRAHKNIKTKRRSLEHDHKYSEEDILSKKKSGLRKKRSSRVGVWRPRLESISEDQVVG